MLITRQSFEEEEVRRLSLSAVKSLESRGRDYPEALDPYRTDFQRDRDRVIHSKAFRRSKGKTQVFVAHYGDHYRSRMTHSLEVAQISRDIARTLGLNEDLAEAIALAHDLGHTPFGHAGEHALNEMMAKHGLRFEHNEQSLRIVEKLEYRYADFVGLNLTYEVRDGLIKHRTTYDHPAIIDHPMASLEAQVVNLADEIAYQNHDVDDGLRSGIVTVDQLKKLALWQEAQKNVRKDLGEEVWMAMTVTSLIKLMITDLYQESDHRIEKGEIKSLNDVYKSQSPVIGFSADMQKMNEELKKFLYEQFYHSPGITAYNEQGASVIGVLFTHFIDHFKEIPIDPRAEKNEPRPVLVKDYIAGMTDNFALELYQKITNNPATAGSAR